VLWGVEVEEGRGGVGEEVVAREQEVGRVACWDRVGER